MTPGMLLLERDRRERETTFPLRGVVTEEMSDRTGGTPVRNVGNWVRRPTPRRRFPAAQRSEQPGREYASASAAPHGSPTGTGGSEAISEGAKRGVVYTAGGRL